MVDTQHVHTYRRSQYGWVIICLFAPMILFMILSYFYQWGNNPLTLVPFVLVTCLLGIIISLFYQLTIVIKDSELRLIYGIGLIRFRFKIDSLEGIKTIKTPWYYGLGIRLTPRGMLYNIHGSKAVQIKYLTNGISKSVMIGTPEPKRLTQKLKKAFPSTGPIG